MKLNRSFLYGLGTGLIFASLIFGISDLAESKSSPQSATAVSQPLPSAAGSSQSNTFNDQTNTQKPAEQKPSEQKPAADKPKATVSVTIKEGMYGEDIANLLKEKGVIEDAAAFLNASADQVNKIRIGSYDLPIHGDFAQIIQIITSK